LYHDVRSSTLRRRSRCAYDEDERLRFLEEEEEEGEEVQLYLEESEVGVREGIR